MIVACVLRSGGVYTPEYVHRLKQGVNQYLPGHDFVCFSDVDVPNRIPLVTDWPGWWSKLEMFREPMGKVLYMDLDTIIQGSLEEIASYPHKFTMLQDFMCDRFASGVMAWDGDHSHIFREFDPEMIPDYRGPRHGDQAYISERVNPETFQSLFPGQIVSRKIHKDRSSARVICYHGKPKPHETGWAA